MLNIERFEEKKWVYYIYNIIFIFSGTALTALLSVQGPIIQRVIGVILSAIIFFFLAFKFKILKKVFFEINKGYLLIAGLFSAVTVYYFSFYFYSAIFYYKIYSPYYKIFEKFGFHQENYDKMLKLAAVFAGALAFFSIFVFWYWLFSRLIPITFDYFIGLDKMDKLFLITSTIIFSILIIMVYSTTNVFYSPMVDGKVGLYDIVYTSDSGGMVLNNVFVNIAAFENDLRHALFGLYSLPFGIIAIILSKVIFFVPNSYPLLLAIVQVPLLSISGLLMCKMMKLNQKSKFFLLLIFSISYPYIFYVLCLEHYLIGVFYLIVFIYTFLERKTLKSLLYIGATGTFISSGILFPFISRQKKLMNWIKDIEKTALMFFSLAIVFGKLSPFLNFKAYLKENMKFAGGQISFTDKVFQYISFIKSCFIKPIIEIKEIKYTLANYTASYHSYQLEEIKTVSIIGLLLLALVILGFLLNYKNNFARVCIFWVTFSFVIMCVVGWGTSENGLILYSIYFSWAYVCLAFMAIERLFSKIPKIKYSLLVTIVVIMMFINIIGVYELIQFGLRYYPV